MGWLLPRGESSLPGREKRNALEQKSSRHEERERERESERERGRERERESLAGTEVFAQVSPFLVQLLVCADLEEVARSSRLGVEGFVNHSRKANWKNSVADSRFSARASRKLGRGRRGASGERIKG